MEMELQKTNSEELVHMIGGDGPYSYANNSSHQRWTLEGALGMISEGIAEKFNIKRILSSSSPSIAFTIADLGCSVGPNTFIAMQTIVESIQHKYDLEHINPQNPEFQVFFNDNFTNDFNKLFVSFPPNKPYFAAACPGSFYKRLFPKRSVHFVHSSTSINWLSRVPKQVRDVNSPAFNKGRIHWRNAGEDVKEAYLAQFAEDMDSFFSARSEELVSGGLMAPIFPTLPKQMSYRKPFPHYLEILENCVLEMMKEGLFDEAKVDACNIPMYFPFADEFQESVKNNGCFSIERFEELNAPPKTSTPFDPQKLSNAVRAAFEGILKAHLGSENLDKLFARYTAKGRQIFKSNVTFDHNYFALLKRK